jgi:hypothetical protein
MNLKRITSKNNDYEVDYCNLNLKGLDEQNEDNNESSLVLEYI